MEFGNLQIKKNITRKWRGTFLIVIGVLLGLFLVYMNTVATVIIFKTPEFHPLFNVFRSLFIWLVPVVGFAFTLRFTKQSHESKLHYVSVPKFIRDWLYDESIISANPNADRNYGKAVMYGVASVINEIRNGHG